MSSCLAILNYNGVHHLEHLLPTALEAARQAPVPCAVVVLDNRSTKNDREWVAEHYPEVEVVLAPENDFLFSYNWFAGTRSEETLVFLNSDLRLDAGFVAPLLRHFAADDVFAVSAKSWDWDGVVATCGPARLTSHHGWWSWAYECGRQELAHTLFTSGGFMAVDRLKFLELGGFNPLFRPAYGEDVDLGFRAWRRGWRCLYEPASVVWHRENGSEIGSGGNGVSRLVLRAQLLFQWSAGGGLATRLQRAVHERVLEWRRRQAGRAWWGEVRRETRREWREKREQYRHLRTSAAEVRDIQRRIERPV